METGGIAIGIGSNPIQEGWTPITTIIGGLMARKKKFTTPPILSGRITPKEEWEWSDWRMWENDMFHVIHEYLRLGMEVFEPHYGD